MRFGIGWNSQFDRQVVSYPMSSRFRIVTACAAWLLVTTSTCAICSVLAFLFIPVKADAQDFSVLYSFCSTSNCPDGATPRTGLTLDAKGSLYGTTYEGGASRLGTVFKLDSSGVQSVLYSFCSAPGCTDGSNPEGGLIQDAVGNLYGTTVEGGASADAGTVFKVDSSGVEAVLHSFCSTSTPTADCADGADPQAGLIQDASGSLYGTTTNGGANAASSGTVFKVDSLGVETVLYSFCSTSTPTADCTDGAGPNAALIQDTAGNLYGTTSYGGANANWGAVFKVNNAGVETVLHSFCSSSSATEKCTDGATPQAGLIRDTAGNLYGTTTKGGANGLGTVFKVDSTGAETVLYSFCSAAACIDGASPQAGLIQDAAGNLYGTTASAGANSGGTIFKVDNTGVETVLYSFCSSSSTTEICTDGASPQAGLIQDAAGNLYGTTSGGGANDFGTVFSLSGATVGPPQAQALQFIPVTPCRIADTRGASGPFGGPEMAAGSSREFDIPQSSCGIPSTASAYSLNVTVVPSASLSYLTLWPTGQSQPNVSTMNSDGRVKANAAITPAGTNGGVSVFVTDATQVILDIDGYFVPAGSSSAVSFYPVTPCRIADTRGAAGLLGGPYLAGGSSRSFPVESSSCNLPSSAQAYSLNVTAIPHATLNYLTTWPTGQNQPYVSTLNSSTGAVTANAAIVPAGTSGAVSIFVSDDADLILDVNGYFAPLGTGGLSLYTEAPCRVVDTRPGAFTGQMKFDVAGSSCGPPAAAQAFVLNATAVPNGALDYLTLWQDGGSQPGVSTLNASDGLITSNMAIVPTVNGSVDAFGSETTNLILDISGYFAP